mmetsp:Transcript_10263/g.27393  ORF Transcript_10263/g.27393 Transcript_10263/m.27393 type:complete len:221 (-) Transcript_10263:79-741(-)
MEKTQSKFTAPLVFVVVAQVLICACRSLCGDLLGGLQDGVAALVGLAAVRELTALPAILYGLACTLGFLYDMATSLSFESLRKMAHSRLTDFGHHRGAPATVLQVVLVMAPILSMLGAILAVRLYQHVVHCEASEFMPLTANSPGTAFWPHPPTPPLPPLCSKRRNISQEPGERRVGKPFQAIFGTPLRQPAFPPFSRSQKGAEVRAPSATPSEEPGSVL